MFSQTFLVFLFCVHVATTAIHNNSSIVKTFGIIYNGEPTDEPINVDVPYYPNENKSVVENVQVISDEAKMFLTGPLSTIFIPSVYTLICLVSLPLNTIAVVSFARQIRPKKPAVIYMLNLACADLLLGLMLPFKMYYHFNGNDWTFGPAVCRVVTAAFYCNMHCSVLLITCISVDRMLAVVYPFDSLVWRRPRNAAIACITVWILGLAGSIPLVLSEQTFHLKELSITTCHDSQKWDDLLRFKMYFISFSCVLFFLSLFITAVCYSRVVWTLSRVPRGVTGRSRRRKRALLMALTVLVLFVLCFTPTNCLLLVHYLLYSPGEPSVESQKAFDATYSAYLFFVCVGSLNCCLDPLVYYFGSSQCQRQMASVLACRKDVETRKNLFSSTDSSQSSTRTIIKASYKLGYKANSSPMDSIQKDLNSQYKTLLV